MDEATPTDRYAVRIAGTGDEVMRMLKGIAGILKVEYIGTKEKDSYDFIVESNKDIDIRRVLFTECAKRGWFVLLLSRLGLALEDIFLNIIDSDDRKKLSGSDDEKNI